MGEAPTHGEAEERAQFMLRMRARGVGDLRLLRALERAPRSLFMPQRYADIAARDIALPIGCGQTAPPPSIVAAMIETLDVQPGVRVLEIGGGTGYASALLAQMAGEILSLERCETLAVEAAERLAAFGVDNVEVVFADGLTYRPVRRTFDRILVHGLIEAPATRLIEMLNAGRRAGRGDDRRNRERAAHRPPRACRGRRDRRHRARTRARLFPAGRGARTSVLRGRRANRWALRRLALSDRGHILVYVRRVPSREVVLFRHILTQSIHLKPSLNSQRAHCQRV